MVNDNPACSRDFYPVNSHRGQFRIMTLPLSLLEQIPGSAHERNLAISSALFVFFVPSGWTPPGTELTAGKKIALAFNEFNPMTR
jgi:hypothetical protein